MSHEHSITIEMDGRHINLPTVSNGRQLSPDDAVSAFRRGELQPLGVFGTQDEAVGAARARSAGASPSLEDRLAAARQAGQRVAGAGANSSGTLEERLGRLRQTLAAPQEAPGIPDPIMTPQPAQPEATFGQAFTRGAATGFIDNVMDLPEAAANSVLTGPLGAYGAAPLLMRHAAGVPQTETSVSGPISLQPGASGTLQPTQRQGGLNVDLPGATDVLAAGDVATQIPAALYRGEPLALRDRFRMAQADQEATDVRFAQEAPAGTAVGDAAGDIATLLAARAPLKAGAARLQQAAPQIATRAQTVLGRALQAGARSVRRGAGRAVETGAEGAFLAHLQGVDPQEAGAYAAGLQVATGPLRGLGKGVFNLVKKGGLGGAVLTAATVSIGLQQIAPGGDPGFFLKNFESRSKEAMIAGLLGLGGAALGRLPANFGGPAFQEIVNVTSRGAVLSALNAAVRDPVVTAPVLQKFGEDPDYFGPKARRLLGRALNSEKIDLRTTVDTLMKDRAFRRKLQSLQAQ